MIHRNYTPFKAYPFVHYNKYGALMGVFIIKASFDLLPDGSLQISEEQEDIWLEDKYMDDPTASILQYPNDLAPEKPNTDIILWAQGENHQNSPYWSCGVCIGALKYQIKISPFYKWKPIIKEKFISSKKYIHHWEMVDETKILTTPIIWSYSYGGIYTLSDEQDVYHPNPLGKGLYQGECIEEYEGHNLLAMDESLTKPDQPYESHAFSAVPPFWKIRAQYAGTYDEYWLKNLDPEYKMPKDFDENFYQAAPPNLIYKGYLKGDEEFILENIYPNKEGVSGSLPNIHLRGTARLKTGEIEDFSFNLDTVFFDLRKENPKLYLTWRMVIPNGDNIRVVEARIRTKGTKHPI